MGKVIAAITTSVDGYIVGPKDGPEHGLGIGGERLHYWVMGGPWTYADDGHDTDGMHGADREYYDSITDEAARSERVRLEYEQFLSKRAELLVPPIIALCNGDLPAAPDVNQRPSIVASQHE